MSDNARRRTPTLLRVVVDDIHHIRGALRRRIDKHQYLRLGVTLEESALGPYVTPREMENGELDFDRQILIPLKENLKSLFFHLYDARPMPLHRAILASGKISMGDILADSSTWTVPLLKDGDPMCRVEFFVESVTLPNYTEEWLYYAPRFTSPFKEAASAVRRVTKPTCVLCHCTFHRLFHSLFIKSIDDPE